MGGAWPRHTSSSPGLLRAGPTARRGAWSPCRAHSVGFSLLWQTLPSPPGETLARLRAAVSPFVTGGDSHSCYSAANPRDCLWGGTSPNGAVFSMPLGAGWHCALALTLLRAGGKEKGVRPAPTLPRGPGSCCGEVAADAPRLPRWDVRMPCLGTYYVLQVILQGRKLRDARGRAACPSSRSNWRCLHMNPSSWEKTRLFQNNQGHSLQAESSRWQKRIIPGGRGCR